MRAHLGEGTGRDGAPCPENGQPQHGLRTSTMMLRCMVVGAWTTGKTFLLMIYASDALLEDYLPTVFNHYTFSVTIGGS